MATPNWQADVTQSYTIAKEGTNIDGTVYHAGDAMPSQTDGALVKRWLDNRIVVLTSEFSNQPWLQNLQ
jgi:hypothetical protein